MNQMGHRTLFEYVARLRENPSADIRLEASPHEGLVLVAPFDGIGGARSALELLGIKPAMYISIETDTACNVVVKNAWPEAVSYTHLTLPTILLV